MKNNYWTANLKPSRKSCYHDGKQSCHLCFSFLIFNNILQKLNGFSSRFHYIYALLIRHKNYSISMGDTH